MKKYMNINTGEVFTLEELHKLYDQFESEMRFESFEDFLEDDLLEEVADEEEILEKYWWAVDECKTDIWTVKFDTREEALQHMKNDWNLLSREGKKIRQGFYIGFAEEEPEDENTPNWDTMTDVVNITEVEE